MEPRAAAADYDKGTGNYTLWSTSQNPHVLRLILSAFVLGIPDIYYQSNNGFIDAIASEWFAYVQDSWKLNPRLTINAGLRLDVDGEPSPLGRSFYASPRLGFAWDPMGDHKTVIRGGGGIYYQASTQSGTTTGFTQGTNYTTSLDGGVTPAAGASLNGAYSLVNPFPNGLLQVPGRSPNYQQLLYGQGPSAPILNQPHPYAQQWDFDIEQELPGNTALSVAYAGSKGTHLPGANQNLDQLPDQFMSLGATRLNQQVPNPFYGQVLLGTLAGPGSDPHSAASALGCPNHPPGWCCSGPPTCRCTIGPCL